MKPHYSEINRIHSDIPITLTIIERRTFEYCYDTHEVIHEKVDKVADLIWHYRDNGGGFLLPGERLRFLMAAALYFYEACCDAQDHYLAVETIDWHPHWSPQIDAMGAWDWWTQCLGHYYHALSAIDRFRHLRITPPSDADYIEHRADCHIHYGGYYWQAPRIESGLPMRKEKV